MEYIKSLIAKYCLVMLEAGMVTAAIALGFTLCTVVLIGVIIYFEFIVRG